MQTRRKKANTKIAMQTILRIVFLSAFGVTMVFPFLWMVSTSLKSIEEIYSITINLIPSKPDFGKYLSVWKDADLIVGFKNSFLVALPVITIGTFTSSLAAFSFSKMRLPHGDKLFIALLSTIMLPFAVVMLPQFALFTELGWTDTLLPLIVPGLFGNIGMIFFLRQFMTGIPNELFEAGRIDGCSAFGLYSRVMFPIIKPAIAVQVVMWFMGVWNDYLGPIIYLNSPENFTIQVLISNLKSQYVSQTDMALIMVASVLAILPVLIVFLTFQRYFVDTLSTSGMKI
jgi:multiple sugar transport system permease protein